MGLQDKWNQLINGQTFLHSKLKGVKMVSDKPRKVCTVCSGTNSIKLSGESLQTIDWLADWLIDHLTGCNIHSSLGSHVGRAPLGSIMVGRIWLGNLSAYITSFFNDYTLYYAFLLTISYKTKQPHTRKVMKPMFLRKIVTWIQCEK